jgi:rhamnose transport system ATP-binding protein
VTPPVLGTRAISKAFGGVLAVRSISCEILAGEVHAIVGENGAGKSTLMRLLGGAERPDAGTVLLDGEPVRLDRPAAALAAGIRTIHQEFTLLPDLDVVENVFLGQWLGGSAGLLDWDGMRTEASRILGDLGVELPLDARVRDLSVPQQQLVEIAKALTSPARVMIMDEPSAVLAGRDLDQLFGVIDALTQRGTAVVYISHRLPEVFRVADRVTVLRNGSVVGSGRPIGEVTPEALVSWMLGREGTERLPPRTSSAIGEVRLRVDGLGSTGLLADIDLEVRHGEIVGLAGLVGAGRTSLLRAIFGADTRNVGTV